MLDQFRWSNEAWKVFPLLPRILWYSSFRSFAWETNPFLRVDTSPSKPAAERHAVCLAAHSRTLSLPPPQRAVASAKAWPCAHCEIFASCTVYELTRRCCYGDAIIELQKLFQGANKNLCWETGNARRRRRSWKRNFCVEKVSRVTEAELQDAIIRRGFKCWQMFEGTQYRRLIK